MWQVLTFFFAAFTLRQCSGVASRVSARAARLPCQPDFLSWGFVEKKEKNFFLIRMIVKNVIYLSIMNLVFGGQF